MRTHTSKWGWWFFNLQSDIQVKNWTIWNWVRIHSLNDWAIQELSHELYKRMTNESNEQTYIFHSEIAKQSMFNYLSIYLWVSKENSHRMRDRIKWGLKMDRTEITIIKKKKWRSIPIYMHWFWKWSHSVSLFL